MKKEPKLVAIDLFCGVGGITHGFVREKIQVVAGIDNDPTCKYSYEHNNKSYFICDDIANVSSGRIKKLYKDAGADIKILIGCAPCQPYSSLNPKRVQYKKKHSAWDPLEHFIRIIEEVKPQIVSMENVKELSDEKKYPIFKRFLACLTENDYSYAYEVVDTSTYGVPQKRKRLVLLASRMGEISLIDPTHKDPAKMKTVRDVIGNLQPILDGEVFAKDPLHQSSKLSKLNKSRIKATPKNGGSAKDWPEHLVLDCHKVDSGKTYMATVYGRMRWDEPSPTITTNCLTLGTGRFGHPTQDRAISLREAALLQSFPKNYDFIGKEKVSKTILSRHIGNAVPVRLAQVIAQSIKLHVEEYTQ